MSWEVSGAVIHGQRDIRGGGRSNWLGGIGQHGERGPLASIMEVWRQSPQWGPGSEPCSGYKWSGG